MKCHHAARWNVRHDASLWIATRSRYFVADLEVAEAGKFDGVTALKRIANFREECLDHVFRFALVQADVFDQEFAESGLSQRRWLGGCMLDRFGRCRCSPEGAYRRGKQLGGEINALKKSRKLRPRAVLPLVQLVPRVAPVYFQDVCVIRSASSHRGRRRGDSGYPDGFLGQQVPGTDPQKARSCSTQEISATTFRS